MQELVTIFVSFVFGISFFFWSMGLKKKCNIIEDLPTSKIRSIAMGVVELYGKVAKGNSKKIIAPFSGEECVFSMWEVSKFVKGKKEGEIRKIKGGVVSGPFYLDDGTGKVLIDPTSAEFFIPLSYTYDTKNPSENLIKFLEEKQINVKDFFGNYKHLKYREWNIYSGQDLFVIGSACDNPYIQDSSSQNNSDDILICKGKKQNIYFISSNKEKNFLFNIKIHFYIFRYVGIIMILVAISGILNFLGLF